MSITKSDNLGILCIFLIGICWGSAFVPLKLLSETTSPSVVAFMRLFIGSLVVLPALWIHKIDFKMMTPVAWIKNAVLAFFCLTLPFAVIAKGIAYIDSGTGAILMGLVPIGTAALCHFYIPTEKINRIQVVGLVLAMFGIFLISGAGNFSSSSTIGIFLVILAAISYAIGNVLARLWTNPKTIHPFTMLLLSWVLMLPILPFFINTSTAENHVLEWTLLLVLGLFPTGIATLLYLWAIARMSAFKVSNAVFVTQLTGLMAGFVLGESLTMNKVLGAAAIAAGLYLMLKMRKTKLDRIQSKGA